MLCKVYYSSALWCSLRPLLELRGAALRTRLAGFWVGAPRYIGHCGGLAGRKVAARDDGQHGLSSSHIDLMRYWFILVLFCNLSLKYSAIPFLIAINTAYVITTMVLIPIELILAVWVDWGVRWGWVYDSRSANIRIAQWTCMIKFNYKLGLLSKAWLDR